MKASFVSVLSVAAAVSAASNDTLVTSTILQTNVYTVTSCAPTVTNCPALIGKVTSEILTTTTICPATATFVPAPPAVTPPSGPSTQTFYNTQVYTITSCAPTVTNCPVGKVTSSVITSTAVVSKPATSAVAPPVSTGPAAPGVPSPPASVSGNSGKPSSVVYSLPGGASSCAPAITSYITVTAGASSVPVVPGTAGSNSGASSKPAGCGGVGSPACPVSTSTPSKSATCGGAGSPACPVYGTAAPSGSIKTNTTTTVPFTGGAATQKTAGLLMVVGIAAALL